MNYRLLHRISRKLARTRFANLQSWRTKVMLQIFGHEVGKNLRIEGRQTWFFERDSQLTIGNNVHLRDGVRIHIGGNGSLTIEDGCELKGNVTIEVLGTVRIKQNSLIVDGTCIYCMGEIHIGSDVMIAAHTTMTDCEHGTALNGIPMHNQPLAQVKAIIIGNDVWIGAHATILGGVKIGEGSIIGASSVVKSDIPPYSVAVGAPAKVKGSRRDNTVI